MGYSTDFKGELKFTHEMNSRQLAALHAIFGEDRRKHPEWEAAENFSHVDLAFTPDFQGVRWSGAEKTYGLENAVNTVIRVMRKTWPDFGLTGQLQAQGEDMDDRWILEIGDDGWAKKAPVVLTGTKVRCPECLHQFRVEV